MEDTFENFLPRFRLFKTGYDHFVESHTEAIVNSFSSGFNRLQKNYAIIKNLVEEVDQFKAEQFNVFHILDRGKYEVSTHTPFLAELLNPNGSHGQKNLFLSKFLNLLLCLPEEADDFNWLVYSETEFIDLQIVNYPLKKAIFIENKIYTDAHDGQLSRYFKKWRDGYWQDNGAFIYLSPNQNKNTPANDGFSEEVCPKEQVMDVLCIWSYQDEIHRWLKEVLPLVKSEKVRGTLRQYMDTIMHL